MLRPSPCSGVAEAYGGVHLHRAHDEALMGVGDARAAPLGEQARGVVAGTVALEVS